MADKIWVRDVTTSAIGMLSPKNVVNKVNSIIDIVCGFVYILHDGKKSSFLIDFGPTS